VAVKVIECAYLSLNEFYEDLIFISETKFIILRVVKKAENSYRYELVHMLKGNIFAAFIMNSTLNHK
jgi:hypothetical protein